MQLYAHLTQEQLSQHLHALRQEAAQARLVSGRPGLVVRVLRFFRRQAQTARPSATGSHGVHTT